MESLETYIWEHRQSLYRVAYTYVRSEQDALDIVSASIVKAMRAKPRLDDERAAAAWVYRVVINTAKDHLRRAKWTVAHADSVEPAAREYDPTLRMDLDTVLSQLPEKYRIIIVLHYFEDRRLADVANMLGENLSTVKSRLRRALLLMRADMEEFPSVGNGDCDARGR